jgi:hypothetical protein
MPSAEARTGSWAREIAAIAAGAALAIPRVALAHQVGMSRGDYEVAEHGIDARISLSRADLMAAIEGLDADRDGVLTEAELSAKEPEVAKVFARGLVVRVGGAPCPVTLASALFEAPDGIAIDLHAACPSMTGSLSLDLGFVEALGPDHRHVTHVGGAERPFEDLSFRGKTHIELPLAPPPARRSPNMISEGSKRGFAGIDHLVFAGAIVAFAGRLRASAAVAAALAAASVAGFALVASGVFVPSARVVGPAVAATLVYLGLDVIATSTSAGSRSMPWIALPFGFVHGFAYAHAFSELDQPASLSACAGFLGGIEITVTGIAAVTALAVAWARRRAGFERWGMRAIGACVALAGVAWLVARIVRTG